MSVNHPNADKNTAPAQGQMYIASEHYQSSGEEIDLRVLFGALWKGKWWIIGITSLFAVASVLYALSLPNEYKATAVLAPASKSSGGSLNSTASQIGALAAKYAGVSLGAPEANDAVIAVEIMKTWGFQEEFINRHNLQVPIFAAKGWNQSTNELILDEKIYDAQKKNWASEGKSLGPTSWELYEEFKDNLSISEDKSSGFIRVSFTHYSPEFAHMITSWLVEDINALLKERALSDATKNIQYLESQISKTALSGMQEVFYALIEEQTKTKMLANVSDEYVFKYISKSRIPEMKSGPKRATLCVAGVLLGGFLSMIFLFIKSFLGNKREN